MSGPSRKPAALPAPAGALSCSQPLSILFSAARQKKGDVLGIARIAAIQAAKRTGELIPLCHPLGLTRVAVEFMPDAAAHAISCETVAETFGRTGVEMEALTAVSIALLTIYDMVKAVDRGMTIEGIRLLEKSGGKSGHWVSGQCAQGHQHHP